MDQDGPKISLFLQELKEGKSSFRYFQKRPISIIRKHILTIIAVIDNSVVGYGHLDRDEENRKVWLGIATADQWRGKGIAKRIICYLLDFAEQHNLNEIFLTVDKDNPVAIHLYKKFGFQVYKSGTNTSMYRWRRNQ